MNKFRRSQQMLAAIILLALAVGLRLGILGEDSATKPAKTPLERIISLACLVFVLVPMVLYWILPSASGGKNRRLLGESAFVFSFYSGIVIGLLGLCAALTDPGFTIRSHMFELLFVLYGLNFVFWARVMKSRSTTDVSGILDEKQIRNLSDSAAVTLLAVTGIMAVMYFVSYHGVFAAEGMVWFLVYFFTAMTVFSLANLVYFRRG
jgi:hypothetical protein